MREFMCSNISRENFDTHFDQFMRTISSVIEKHAPSKQCLENKKRIQQKPWLTKALLVSVKNKKNSINLTF